MALHEVERIFVDPAELEQSAPTEGADFSYVDRNGLMVTPADSLTGLPLSVLTEPDDFYYPDKDCSEEFHHQQHPVNAEEFGYVMGRPLPKSNPDRLEGLALRHSRGHRLPNWLHDDYHDLFWGPILPGRSIDKHRAVLLGIARAVPWQALKIKEGDYSIVDLNPRQHEFLRRITHHEGAGRGWEQNKRGKIGTYLTEYALKNFLKDISNDTKTALQIEQFRELRSKLSSVEELKWDPEEARLKEGEPGLRRQTFQQSYSLAERIIEQALRASVEHVQPIYLEALRSGMVGGTKRDLGLVAMKFFGYRTEYSEKLEEHLRLVDEKEAELSTQAA